MKLSSIRIQNFRSFEDATIDLDDYTCFVGANGAGKSTVLMALNILFRENKAPGDVARLGDEDFHFKNTAVPIRITGTFTNLSADANEDFSHYVRQDQLVVITEAIWEADSQSAPVVQKGARLVMADFAPYFAADSGGTLVSGLREIYDEIRSMYPDLEDVRTKPGMVEALRTFEESHTELCTLEESNHQFYGWSKGTNKLEKYCQWIYIPAVKDASDEQDEQKNSALGPLLQRTARSSITFDEGLENLRKSATESYKALLDERQNALTEVSNSIQERLRTWSHPGAKVELHWHFDEKKSVSVVEPFARANIGEGQFLGEVMRLGHGMQRSFIIALLQELAQQDLENAPTLILGFEEPELYQHPPQARHLASVIEELSGNSAQILATTHSPYFVTSTGFESIRVVRTRDDGRGADVHQLTANELAQRLSTALGSTPSPRSTLLATIDQIMQPSKNELYFCHVPILVEGTEDVALIATQIRLLGLQNKFREHGCHFIVCGGKTNMSRPLAIAKGLAIPAFTIFDGDFGKDGQERDNQCLLNLCDSDSPPTLEENIFSDNFVVWKTDIQECIRNQLGDDEWSVLVNDCRTKFGFQSVSAKNGLLLAACVESLWDNEVQLECLVEVSNAIIAWAEKCSTPSA